MSFPQYMMSFQEQEMQEDLTRVKEINKQMDISKKNIYNRLNDIKLNVKDFSIELVNNDKIKLIYNKADKTNADRAILFVICYNVMLNICYVDEDLQNYVMLFSDLTPLIDLVEQLEDRVEFGKNKTRDEIRQLIKPYLANVGGFISITQQLTNIFGEKDDLSDLNQFFS